MISAQQGEQLQTDGFVLLPRAIPTAMVQQWRAIAEQHSVEAVARHVAGLGNQRACVVDDPCGPRLTRLDGILASDPEPLVTLLATPALMGVARDLCGFGAIPLQADILYKQQHPHPVIAWHQGPGHGRSHPYLNVGVYLDDAPAGDGCVRYVPGTQHARQDVSGLAEQHGWDIPGTVEQPAQAGDVLVQDMMILHGSPPKRSAGVRRTIYIEYRPVAGIRHDGELSPRFIELHERWMAMVAARCHPDDMPPEWRASLPADLGPTELEVAEIMAHHEPLAPAYYGDRRVESDGYPVPRDLELLPR